jgi:hypothetical protein
MPSAMRPMGFTGILGSNATGSKEPSGAARFSVISHFVAASYVKPGSPPALKFRDIRSADARRLITTEVITDAVGVNRHGGLIEFAVETRDNAAGRQRGFDDTISFHGPGRFYRSGAYAVVEPNTSRGPRFREEPAGVRFTAAVGPVTARQFASLPFHLIAAAWCARSLFGEFIRRNAHQRSVRRMRLFITWAFVGQSSSFMWWPVISAACDWHAARAR